MSNWTNEAEAREKIKEMSEVLVRENRMTGEEFEKLMDS